MENREVVIKCWFNTPTESIELVTSCLHERGYNTKCIGKFEYPNNAEDYTLEYISKSDPLILLIWDRAQSPSFLKKLKELKKFIRTRVILFNWDDPHACSEWIERSMVEQQHLDAYDVAFSCCRETEKVYKSFGVKKWKYLPPLCGDYHYPEKDEKFECDVSMMCTNLYPTFPYQFVNRKLLVDALYSSGLKFNLYGPEKFGETYPNSYKEFMQYHSNRKVYYNSKVVISTHIESGDAYLTERDVTALASGGLVLSDPIPNISEVTEGCIIEMKSNNVNDIISQIRDIISKYDEYLPIKEKAVEVSKKWRVEKWVDTVLDETLVGEFVFYNKRGNGGYGDRIVGMAAVNFLANFYGNFLRVVWDDDMSEIFYDSEKFSSDKFLKYEKYRWIDSRAEGAKDFFKNKTPEEIKRGNFLIETNQPLPIYIWELGLNNNKNFVEEYKRSYQEIYTKFLKIVYPPVNETGRIKSYDLGLQIRCGDAYATGKGNHVYIRRDLFDVYSQNVHDIIQKEFSPGVKMFITCDNNEMYPILKEKLKDLATIEVLEKEENFHFDMSLSSSSEMRRCIIEHYLLTRCESVMTMFNSNFGITAALSSGIKNIIILGFTGSYWIREYYDIINRPRAKSRMPDFVYS